MPIIFFLQSNYIKTSKYSVLTFLPLNLFEQFQRLANFYFLCLLVLQLIPAISSLTPVTTALPLIGVLGLTAIKDAYDDIVSRRFDFKTSISCKKSNFYIYGRKVFYGPLTVFDRLLKLFVATSHFRFPSQQSQVANGAEGSAGAGTLVGCASR